MPNFTNRYFTEETAKTNGRVPFGQVDDSKLIYWILPKNKKQRSIFDLRCLTSLVGTQSEKAAYSLVSLWAGGSHSAARSNYSALVDFCSVKSKNSLLNPINDSKTISKKQSQHWQREIDAWTNVELAREGRPRAAGERIGTLNRALAKLMRDGYFPQFRLGAGQKDRHKRSRERPSLLEQVVPSSEAETMSPLKARISAAIEEFVPNFDAEEHAALRDALLSLAADFKGDVPNSPEQIIAALTTMAQNCIRKIQELASRNFRSWECVYEEGRKQIALGDSLIAHNIALAIRGDAHQILYFRNEFNANRGADLIPHCLRCFKEYFESLPPTVNDDGVDRSFLNRLYRGVKGRFEFDAMLFPSADAVAAAMLLTACETALNVAVICNISLPLGIADVPDQPDSVVIGAVKDRANGRYVISVVSKVSAVGLVSAAQAINRLSETNEVLRASFRKTMNLMRSATEAESEEDTDLGANGQRSADSVLDTPTSDIERDATPRGLLFIFRYHATVSAPSEHFLYKRLKYILRDSGLSNELKFTPSAIRPCVLMLQGLSKSIDSQIVANIAGHSGNSNATSAYSFRLLSRMRSFAHVRQYQEKLAKLISNSKGDKQFAADNDDESELCLTVDALQIIQITKPLIEDAQLTILCLQRSNEQLVQTRRTHWVDRCERELAWATVLLEKTESSSLAHLLPSILRKCNQLLINGYIHPLEV